MLEHALPFLDDIAAVFASGGRTEHGHAILSCVARHTPQHDPTHLLSTGDAQFGSDLRAELITEHIDGAQAQTVQKVADCRRQVRDRELRGRRIRGAVSRQVECIHTAIGAELTQHRREETTRAAAMMQADQRRALVETAARRIGCPDMHLPETGLCIRATNMHGGRLRQRQSIAMFGLNHFEETLDFENLSWGRRSGLRFASSADESCRPNVSAIARCFYCDSSNASLGGHLRQEMDACLSFASRALAFERGNARVLR